MNGIDRSARDELAQFGAHPVVVAGRRARVAREGEGFAVYFEEGGLPPFRASGLPSEVLTLAEAHARSLVQRR